jgi:hypothetical protein
MKRDLIAIAALLATSIPSAALAQPRPSGDVPPPMAAPRHEPPPRFDGPEWARDRRELGQDARATRDDWRDLRRAEALLDDYDRAARQRSQPDLARLEDEALELIRQEWEEGRRELAGDRREVRDERGDLRQERREHDRAGAADDRRDLRGDRRDARMERRNLDRLSRIGERLYSLRGRYRGGDVSRKRGLIAEFVRMARKELRWDRRELHEDRRDRGEDHRDMHEGHER